jgi:hypothetical protein
MGCAPSEQDNMLAPRTVKTLAALFFAMTIGTLLLMWMDVDPIHAPSTHLTALAVAEEAPLPVITQAQKPYSSQWQRLVIHSSAEGPSVAGKCHFVVDVGGGGDPFRANAPWQEQAESPHVPGRGHDWNKGAIGVCLVGDFSKVGPSDEQYQALLKLVTDLQQQFKIPASRVYFYGDIAGAGDFPGAAFPKSDFNTALVAVK